MILESYLIWFHVRSDLHIVEFRIEANGSILKSSVTAIEILTFLYLGVY